MLLGLTIAVMFAGQTALANSPLVASGRIEASVQILSGADLVPEGGAPSKDVLRELDGTSLELGSFQCKLKAGKCVFENVKPGTYIPSAHLEIKTEGIAYKMNRSNAGNLVQIKPGKAAGQLEVAGTGDSKLVFLVDRYLDSTPKPQPPPPPRDLSKLDLSFKLEVWVRVQDQAEGGSHERLAHSGELDGTVLHLGKAHCQVASEVCAFSEIFPGTFKLSAEIKNSEPQKSKIELAPDTPEFTVLIDNWTHRPRMKNWPKVVTVTFLKTFIRN